MRRIIEMDRGSKSKCLCDGHLGHYLAEDRSSRLPEVLLAGEIRPGAGRTIYNISGDWFARLNILFLVSILAAIAMRGVKARIILQAQL